eukprot:Platyproteum_vivax@DN15460_c0_g1_i1.p1
MKTAVLSPVNGDKDKNAYQSALKCKVNEFLSEWLLLPETQALIRQCSYACQTKSVDDFHSSYTQRLNSDMGSSQRLSHLAATAPPSFANQTPFGHGVRVNHSSPPSSPKHTNLVAAAVVSAAVGASPPKSPVRKSFMRHSLENDTESELN